MGRTSAGFIIASCIAGVVLLAVELFVPALCCFLLMVMAMQIVDATTISELESRIRQLEEGKD